VRDAGADERLERRLIEDIALGHIDRARSAQELAVEEPFWVGQARTR
jgi:hypothetical protein